MKNLHLLLITLGGSLLLIIGVTFLFSKQQEQATAVTQSQLADGARHFYSSVVNAATPSASPRASQSPNSTQSATATSSAQPAEKITVTEFSDFQCPACRASSQLKNEIFAQFSPSEVEFVYRHFPLTTIHDKALLAAQVGEVAAKFNRFWPMHDKLFQTQDDWKDLSVEEAKTKFIEYAVELGMNKDDFSKTLEDDTVKQAVQTDVNLSDQLNLSSTPTFFVNDKKVSAPEVIPTIEQIRQE